MEAQKGETCPKSTRHWAGHSPMPIQAGRAKELWEAMGAGPAAQSSLCPHPEALGLWAEVMNRRVPHSLVGSQERDRNNQ